MKKVVKIHNKVLCLCLACFLMIFAFVMAFNVSTTDIAFAETNNPNAAADPNGNGDVSPLGLYVSLSLSINGGNGKVWATVRNDVTLFPATVYVIVELYSSDTYHESHLDMELVATNSIADLNMGKSIVAECSTGGVQKYWQARMRYKKDNSGWKSEATNSWLFGPNGEWLE